MAHPPSPQSSSGMPLALPSGLMVLLVDCCIGKLLVFRNLFDFREVPLALEEALKEPSEPLQPVKKDTINPNKDKQEIMYFIDNLLLKNTLPFS